MTKSVSNKAHAIAWALFFVIAPVLGSYENPEGPRRDKGVTRFLNVSVRVNTGSGTLCHYDPKTKLAHILTCAHVIEKTGTIEVETFLVDGRENRKTFNGKIIAIDHANDLCLIAIISSIELDFAAVEFSDCDVFYPSRSPRKRKLVVCGRDGGTKPALYEAYVDGSDADELLQSRQYPSQGGRSGGGVFNEHRRIVAINVMRLTNVGPVGNGLWVPCWKIHRFLKEYGQEWLIYKETLARIPILDKEGRVTKIGIPE